MSGHQPTFAVGDRVRCERQAPARGTWSRFAGRTGTVVSINVSRSVNGSPDGVEIGVKFTAGTNGQPDAWFLPAGFVAVDRAQPASGRLLAANAPDGESTPTAQAAT